jgi:hypothetical protein
VDRLLAYPSGIGTPPAKNPQTMRRPPPPLLAPPPGYIPGNSGKTRLPPMRTSASDKDK